jgi:acyl homoserine lactone synthase
MRLITTQSGMLSEFPAHLAEALMRYRHRIFIQRLGWILPTLNGAERDQFDRDDTLYAVALDGTGELRGCARLLPTSLPYLLDVVFPDMVQEKPLPSSSTIWEISRFASTCAAATRRLLAETVACAAQRGARRLITMSPLGVERLLQRMGVGISRAGKPVLLNGQYVFACWIEINAQTYAALDLDNHGYIMQQRSTGNKDANNDAKGTT